MSSSPNNPFAAPRPTPAWLGWFALAFFLFTQTYAVVTSPADAMMGHLQKILYVHVPAAWVTFGAFGVVLVASLHFLWKEDERADLLAASAAEIGSMFCGLTLVQGMLWGRPTWGVWWSWDARLTSTLVLFLIFVGYLALRSFVEDPHRRGQWSAAVGILGALNVPIVYMSVKWWRTLHQPPSNSENLDPFYALGKQVNWLMFTLILVVCIAHRYRAHVAQRVYEMEQDEAALARRRGA